MPRARPPVNPEVLKWAVEESGYSHGELAAHPKIDESIVAGWVEGAGGPTRGQFTRLAEKLRRPKSIFFLPKPPESSGLPPQLRRAVGRTRRELSAAELLWVRRARRMQRLLSLLERDEQGEVVAIPELSPRQNAGLAGATLRTWLGVMLGEQLEWASPTEAFDAWRDASESRGVLVMQLQLGRGGLRGFALADDYAPLVAVNTRENVPARVFTMLHELAHLASETATACLEGVGAAADVDAAERWCEDVASAALLPTDSLMAEVGATARVSEPDFALVEYIASRFNASLRATAVGLIRAGLAGDDLYEEVERNAPLADFDKGFGRARTPPRAPKRRLLEVGPRAAGSVLAAMSRDHLSELDARRYLRLNGAELAELASEIGGRA